MTLAERMYKNNAISKMIIDPVNQASIFNNRLNIPDFVDHVIDAENF